MDHGIGRRQSPIQGFDGHVGRRIAYGIVVQVRHSFDPIDAGHADGGPGRFGDDVFPMVPDESVRTRLVESLEVAVLVDPHVCVAFGVPAAVSRLAFHVLAGQVPSGGETVDLAGRPYPVVSDHAFWPELVDFVDQVMQELDVPWRPPYPAHALDGGPAGLLATDLDGDIGIRIVGVVHVPVPSMTGSFVPSWGSRALQTFRPRYGCVGEPALRLPPLWAFPPSVSSFVSETGASADIGMSARGSSDRRLLRRRAHVVGRAEKRSVGPVG